MRWLVFVLGALPLLSYGLLNLVTPRTTLAWQARSTARHHQNNPRKLVAETVQRWVGTRDDASDRTALRRIRIIGLAEIAIALGITLALVMTA